MRNYSDVLGQLVGHGLQVSDLQVGRLVRCKVDGDSEKRGWYALHEMPMDGGSVLVGTYGVWRGDDNGLIKVELDKDCQPSKEQLEAIRKRVAEDKKRAEAERKRRANAASKRAEKAWHVGSADGHVDYFDKKNVLAHGIRYSKGGAAMVPMLDTSGMVHGIQFIFDSVKHGDEIKKLGRNKTYWPSGLSKKGHFHLIGGSPVDLVLIAEGYATAASLYEATGIPVAVAFDANNLIAVGEAIRAQYPARIIFCADDDALAKCMSCKKSVNVNDGQDCPHCGKPHKRKNTGVETAGLAAMQLGMYSVKPLFADEAARFEFYNKNQGKHTDFNDLHALEGLHAVRSQIEAAIESFGLRRKVAKSGAVVDQGGGESEQLKPISSSEELLERFALVYGKGGTVFDYQEHMLLTLSDMRDACQSREIHRRWQESPERIIVRPENVGFDPAGEDPQTTCNLWAGWPTLPKKGGCERTLELLEYICGDDVVMHDWVLKWLAFPIQHPGAKMKSTLVVHGPQGTGKNLFFEMVMAIYGRYGRTIDQSAIEDKFNDWASGKLFLIADEVVARSDLYHVKNKLKAFITGDWIRINPKNMAAYEERNHVNLVFLSNERMPVVLEEDDRRHAVIWTPPKLSPSFYQDVAAEIKNGGIAALHDYLLNLPLGDFDTHSKPPMSTAKQELINLGKDNILRFYDDWTSGDLDGVQLMPVLSGDLYELYKTWTSKQGVRAAPMNKAIDAISKRPGVDKRRKRFLAGTRQSNPKYFLFPPNGQEMNPGNSESGWLGQCVTDFRECIDDYKDSL